MNRGRATTAVHRTNSSGSRLPRHRMGSETSGPRGRPGRIRVGVAGWSYPDWHGPVYPKRKPRRFDPLAYLARYVQTIEINNTFYRPAEPAVAAKWVERIADVPDFRFTAKLWRRFTHERDEAWGRDDVEIVRAGLAPIAAAGRLGALLAQFPWSFRRTTGNREWLGDLADAFADLPLVFEVRHASWNVPDFYAELADRGIGFVNLDQPMFRNSIPPSSTSTGVVGYIRLHGRNYADWFREGAGRDARYDYLYTADELEGWAERVREVAADPRSGEVYAIANNHFEGQAVANALMLRAMLEGKPAPSPPQLQLTYAGALEGYATPAE
ncbi:MAG: DUF72 domain-containing protein [Longimicrobiales bacterium]